MKVFIVEKNASLFEMPMNKIGGKKKLNGFATVGSSKEVHTYMITR